MRRFIILFALILVAAATKASAVAFTNLNFEAFTSQPVQGTVVPFDAYQPISAAAALPGWTVGEDTTTCNAVSSGAGLDETSVSLYGAGLLDGPAIDGNFSVALTSQAAAGGRYYHSSSISQFGLIPASAKYIQFYLTPQDSSPYAIPFVTVGGATVAVGEVSTSNGVQTWTGNVSVFAGLNEQLTFSAIGVSGLNFFDPRSEDNYELDDISFQAPEPGSLGLFVIPLTILPLRRRGGRAVHRHG